VNGCRHLPSKLCWTVLDPIVKADLGELTKPATVLIEKVSDAIGVAFEPTRIRRRARAEADAAVVGAEAEREVARIQMVSRLELTELEQRAVRRFLTEETRKQANVESITEKAVRLLGDDASPQDMDNDWISYFFDSARHISADDMQEVWAKVLAREATTPGTISRRAVSILSVLDARDATAFTTLCRFCVIVGGYLTAVIYDPRDPWPGMKARKPRRDIYSENGLHYETLSNLASVGLASVNPIGLLQDGMPTEVVVRYLEGSVRLRFQKESGNELPTGIAGLTTAGRELALTVDVEPVEGFLDYLIDIWADAALAPSMDLAWRPSRSQ
jgi:hypothetical protein